MRFLSHRRLLQRPAATGRQGAGAAAPDPQAGAPTPWLPTPYVKLQAVGRRKHRARPASTTSRADSCRRRPPRSIDDIIATIAEAKLPVVQAVSHAAGLAAPYARVKPDATAFAQRAAPYNMFVFSDAGKTRRRATRSASWARSAWKKLEPHTHGFYVNEFNDDAARMREPPTASTTTGWWRSRRRSTLTTCSG